MDLNLIRDPVTMMTPEDQMANRIRRLAEIERRAKIESDIASSRALELGSRLPRFMETGAERDSVFNHLMGISNKRSKTSEDANIRGMQTRDELKRYKNYKNDGIDYMPQLNDLWSRILDGSKY